MSRTDMGQDILVIIDLYFVFHPPIFSFFAMSLYRKSEILLSFI